jgi:hypothetical membrane protein
VSVLAEPKVETRRLVLNVAAASAAAAGVGLAVLHLVQPGLHPAWSVLSQYALADSGWLMAVVFVLLAIACGALALALPPERLRRAGRIGRVLLFVAAVGLVLGAVFVVGNPLHDVGSLLGNLGLTLAAVLVGRDLRRGLPDVPRRWSAAAAHAPWISAVLMGVFLGTGTWGIGLLNRAVVLAYIVWLIVAARQARRD